MFKQLIFASLLDSPIDPSTKAPPISLLIAFNNLSKTQGLQIMTLNQGTRALRYLWCYLSQWGTPLQPWKTCFHNQKLWISPRCARLICCSQAQDGTHRQADDTSGIVSLVNAETNNLCPCNHILSFFSQSKSPCLWVQCRLQHFTQWNSKQKRGHWKAELQFLLKGASSNFEMCEPSTGGMLESAGHAGVSSEAGLDDGLLVWSLLLLIWPKLKLIMSMGSAFTSPKNTPPTHPQAQAPRPPKPPHIQKVSGSIPPGSSLVLLSLLAVGCELLAVGFLRCCGCSCCRCCCCCCCLWWCFAMLRAREFLLLALGL